DGVAIGIGHGEVQGEELALGHGGRGGRGHHRGTVRVGDGDGGRTGAVEHVAGAERDVDGEEPILRHGGGGGGGDHRRAVRVGDGDGGAAGAEERVAGDERDAVA